MIGIGIFMYCWPAILLIYGSLREDTCKKNACFKYV